MSGATGPTAADAAAAWVMLRSTQAWLQRDLEVLKPVFERMRVEGADFLQKNVALAEEIRHTFVDLDEIEKELRKAGNAIDKAKTATANYHARLAGYRQLRADRDPVAR